KGIKDNNDNEGNTGKKDDAASKGNKGNKGSTGNTNNKNYKGSAWWPTTSSCNTPCTQDHAFKDLFNAEIKKPTANPSSRTLSTTDCLVSRVPSSRAAGGNYPKSSSRQYLSTSFLPSFYNPLHK
ncbi:MAG: hypothetical protein ACPHNY_06760, partial [Akkermansiaceae bacterium]